jgi:hypothetical protein
VTHALGIEPTLPSTFTVAHMQAYMNSLPVAYATLTEPGFNNGVELSDEKISFICPISLIKIKHPMKGI